MACITVQVAPPPPPMVINSVVVTFDNLNTPYTRSVIVTGTGTGSYQLTDNGSVIANRTLTNGVDSFSINNLAIGIHNICVGSKCAAFTVDAPLPVNRYSCADSCTTAKTVGEFTGQAACKAACTDQRGWEYINGQCIQTITGLYSTKAACEAAHPSPPGGQPILLVNGQTGSVQVNVGDIITIEVKNLLGVLGTSKTVYIYDVNPLPDILLAQGNTDSAGNFKITQAVLSNKTLMLRANWNCISNFCSGEANTVTVKVGSGSSGIPGIPGLPSNIPWGTIAIGAAGIYILGQLIGGRR